LTGRSSLNEEKQAKLKELEELGSRIAYRQVDVTDKQAVTGLIQNIQEEFGDLHGIIHSAGMIRDNFIIRKSKEELQEVLEPKVSGLVNLDEASKDLSLDFFILFSSITGSLGNPGQADYATANAFMDGYASYRNNLVDLKQRHGQTLSINWPLWKDGGMHVSEETEKMMAQSTGMIAMQIGTGIQGLYQSFALGQDQVLIIEGDLIKMKKYLLETSLRASSHLNASIQVDTALLREKTIYQLKLLVGEIIKLSSSSLDTNEPLESYGIDSITITQMNQELAVHFGELSKTLFFEYQTLGALVEYLIADYPQNCIEWTGFGDQVLSMSEAPSGAIHLDGDFSVLTSLKVGKKAARSSVAVNPRNKDREPIAIIGMSGRYPQAKNPKEYWENLKAGKDCIIEIPQDRWSLAEFFHPDPQEAVAQGKSYSKWGGFVEGFADFDPLFFNISPREALNMDPQERLFIESCWELLEDAGYTKEQLTAQYNRRVGVFAGITKTGFNLYGPDLWKQGEQLFPHTSFSSVANRISYLLNLQGPSMPIDTMCSSSLTAIHEACEHIYQGECEMAIAGGVNLYLHPSSYIGLCSQRMLSWDGQCKSFGQGGNGFVPGEGVGCILLKRVSQAIADGDHIYAVIRGTSINHGGKTNGYTVPSPSAQGELIRRALDKAGVNARTISYIEAHGTGTELGDPIEITGLTQAFQKDTQDTGFCAIGSAKSNIGHLEAAAGIAGIAKVVLQMKNKQLVPSLHAQKLNSNISFSKTPFAVQQELTEWKRPVVEINGEKKEYPRIAGISSFGAGGSNAHVVIEEYIPQDQVQSFISITSQNPAIIVLSAKNEERLKEQVQQLLTAIEEQQFSDECLAKIAYTLQVGREAMEERLGVIAGSVKELEEKLNGFVKGQDNIEDVYHGQVKRNKETLALFVADEELQEAIEKWKNRKKYAKILDLWTKGLSFDWNKLYGNNKPRRMSLPTYPFAKEYYWVPETKSASNIGRTSTIAGEIHPLLHKNTSDFSGQRFSSIFTGQEFFLNDHVVKGQQILPGVVYLEMARVAVEQAAGTLAEGKNGIQFKNVVWARPIAVGKQPVEIHIGLFPEHNGEIGYEIYSEPENDNVEPIVHSQGTVMLSSVPETAILDIKELQDKCKQNFVTSNQYYEAFRTMGIDYGPEYQGIEKVYVGSGQVLAKLSLPSSALNIREEFVLHPSLMNSALQAAIRLMAGTGNLKLALPFALQELEIIDSCTSKMWALVQYSDGKTAEDKVQKIDIDLCDETGRICVRMKGFASRFLDEELDLGVSPKFGTLMLHPIWKEQDVAQGTIVPEYVQHLVMLCELGETLQQSIESQINGVYCCILQSQENSIEERFQSYAVKVFEKVQSILKEKPKGKVLIQIVVSTQNEQQLFSGLSGLLKTAQLESPKIVGQLIEVEQGIHSEELIAKLQENSRNPIDNQIRYHKRKRWCFGWSEIEDAQERAKIPWKEQGVYLITGGAGGLGLIFVQEIVKRVKNATMILTGRSLLTEEKQAKLKNLEAMGARIEYWQVDVNDKQAVTSLMQSIQERFGDLHGIIHSAGVIQDNFIIKKSKEEVEQVLAPKVAGLVNLDQASRDLNIEFFILFSSITGSLGNPGQADYSTANSFMDAYAKYRNALVALKQRQGQTLSINWPLWKDGGMHVNEEIEKIMRQSMGMIAMQTETGIRALYQGLAAGLDQVMVLEGDVVQLRLLIYALIHNHENAHGYSKISDRMSELDDDFYQNLLGKISKDELSEEQFKKLIMM
jgi:polyketide synthase PksN